MSSESWLPQRELCELTGDADICRAEISDSMNRSKRLRRTILPKLTR